jgi:acyl carrier protein phosphodiesterase
MNFFAHASVALQLSSDSRFLLGSMLPDLSSMVGLRLRAVNEGILARGVQYHHATDAAFHGAPLFVEWCSQGTTLLSSAGIGRGTARAVAHVGTELLLDGALSDDRVSRAAYGRSLEAAVQERYVDDLDLGGAENAERLHAALIRLSQSSIPEAYRDLQFVSDRLRTILARRPRLAMQDCDLSGVQRFLRLAQEQVNDSRLQLLQQVESGLNSES